MKAGLVWHEQGGRLVGAGQEHGSNMVQSVGSAKTPMWNLEKRETKSKHYSRD